MFELSMGGYIIDTPGIRGFGLHNIFNEELFHFFPEIFKASHACKYHNCTHVHEPDCAVKNAVETGEVSELRYENYLKILFDDDSKHRL
jgi:ribosome biogenesis GTPase